MSAPLETVKPTEAAMDQDDKTGEVATSVEELTLYNMLLPNALTKSLRIRGVFQALPMAPIVC